MSPLLRPGRTGRLDAPRSPEPDYVGEMVLFGDRFPTPSGRGKFVPAEFAEAKDLPDAEFPLVLNTGRVLEHWHTGTMTRRSYALDALRPDPFVEVHPDDLAKLGAADGQEVTVRSRRGAIRLPAQASDGVQPGTRVHPVPLPGGGGERADQRRPRPVREDPRVQVLRGAAGGVTARLAHPVLIYSVAWQPRPRQRDTGGGLGRDGPSGLHPAARSISPALLRLSPTRPGDPTRIGMIRPAG